jgi:hypothetical protein
MSSFFGPPLVWVVHQVEQLPIQADDEETILNHHQDVTSIVGNTTSVWDKTLRDELLLERYANNDCCDFDFEDDDDDDDDTTIDEHDDSTQSDTETREISITKVLDTATMENEEEEEPESDIEEQEEFSTKPGGIEESESPEGADQEELESDVEEEDDESEQADDDEIESSSDEQDESSAQAQSPIVTPRGMFIPTSPIEQQPESMDVARPRDFFVASTPRPDESSEPIQDDDTESQYDEDKELETPEPILQPDDQVAFSLPLLPEKPWLPQSRKKTTSWNHVSTKRNRSMSSQRLSMWRKMFRSRFT